MNRFNNTIFAFSAVAGLGLIGSLMNSHPALLQAAGGPTVTIDASQLPLHVTGIVTSTGTSSVTGTVGVSGTVVTRAADNPAKQPYTQSVVSTSCNAGFCFFTFPAVQGGKRLVIQQFNVYVRPASAATVVDQVELRSDTEPFVSVPASINLPMAQIGTSGAGVGSNTYAANFTVVAYAEAGSSPHVETINRTNGSASDFGRASISGYLVDVP